MKKLALALMCLVSVAFFASCEKTVEHPEPSIAVLQEEGYVADGDVVDLNTDVQFGFVCAANTETGKKLASLVVKVGDTEWANENLSGMNEYTYKGVVKYEPEEKDIIGESVITALLTDEDGKTATATITLSINQPAQPLIGTTIEWIRKGSNLVGNTETEMAGYGLQWTGSYKDIMATIRPIDGATMYLCNGDDFATITTVAEKAAYFDNLAENGNAIDKYRNITTNNSANYNDMLAVVNGENTTLVLISRAEIETGSYGTQITIKGEAK